MFRLVRLRSSAAPLRWLSSRYRVRCARSPRPAAAPHARAVPKTCGGMFWRARRMVRDAAFPGRGAVSLSSEALVGEAGKKTHKRESADQEGRKPCQPRKAASRTSSRQTVTGEKPAKWDAKERDSGQSDLPAFRSQSCIGQILHFCSSQVEGGQPCKQGVCHCHLVCKGCGSGWWSCAAQLPYYRGPGQLPDTLPLTEHE
ncbi:uncharacterized protein LOC132251461 [Alligator mississippiensis]|uniref:uncharacterized protein LOC132251461 n=1 Tax=Alligator mississippiensis TaxID=8496 RepID=UPI002877F619|nr:uncharacterized protein LOC132251461 [Alligator mississippiensis]